MKTRQETVRGITFDPATLFFELVGVDLEGNPFDSEVWVHPQPKSYREAKESALGMMRHGSLVTYVRIKTQLSETLSVTISTVWRDE